MLILDIALVGAALVCAASIIVFSLATGIAPMPSSARACKAMLAAAAGAPAGPIVDLGSGWGTLAILFARRHPEREVIGYELSWLPWLISLLLKRALRLRNLTFRRENFLRADLRGSAVLLCYLYPRAMTRLSRKLEREGPRPAVVISNTFALPARRPDRVIRLDDAYRSSVYAYVLRSARPRR